MADDFGLKIRWTHFPLHPETPPEGRLLSDLFAGREEQIAAMQRRLQDIAAAGGLPYGKRTHTYNSRLAQELGSWADTVPTGGALHGALFRAYFADGRNLADPDVLVDVADSVGLDGHEARWVLTERTFREHVDRDWQRSRHLGVTGVPTFVVGHRGVVGAQPYEVLADLVRAVHGEGPENDTGAPP